MTAVNRRSLLQAMAASIAGTALLAACQSQPAGQSGSASTPTQASGGPTVAPATTASAASKVAGKVTAWMPASCYFCSAADLWNKAHPATTVDVVKGSDDPTKFQAALRSGEGGPDIYQSQPDEIPKDMLHKQLFDWTSRMNDAGITKDFVPFKLREDTHPKTGHIYGFPYQLGVVGMYYREDLLQKVGYTSDMLQNLDWQGYVDLGTKLKQELGVTLDYSTTSNTSFFQYLLWLAGGSFTNQDGTQVTLDSPVGIDVMTKVKSLFDQGLMAPMDPGSEPFWTAARSDKVAIVWGATWFGGYFVRNLTQKDGGFGQWRNVQLPALVKGGPRAVNSGGSPMESPAFTKNPDLAWEVQQFALATVDGALACMSTGTVLCYTPALQSTQFTKQTFAYAGDWHINELWSKYAGNVPNTFYYTAVWDEASTIFGNYQPKILKGDLTVAAGMKAAADEIRKVNDQYVRIMQQE
jgi:lactose/L-arabinose transport system substrate-binding protein